MINIIQLNTDENYNYCRECDGFYMEQTQYEKSTVYNKYNTGLASHSDKVRGDGLFRIIGESKNSWTKQQYGKWPIRI